MKLLSVLLFSGVLSAFRLDAEINLDSVANTTENKAAVETLVCIRHGEKPPGGLGQLTSKGLNRSLALPGVLLSKYGKPQFVFAPNPAQKVDGGKYYYVRPLATIEPTAILCGLPVSTEFGYKEIKGLEQELLKPEYCNATVFVAWEHGLLDQFAKNMVKDGGGDPKQVPEWPGDEYDMIFVFKITRTAEGRPVVAFGVGHEGLNGIAGTYPKPVTK
jgi:hypothetical protein